MEVDPAVWCVLINTNTNWCVCVCVAAVERKDEVFTIPQPQCVLELLRVLPN